MIAREGSVRFCPHCNPCTHDGNEKCRAPAAPGELLAIALRPIAVLLRWRDFPNAAEVCERAAAILKSLHAERDAMQRRAESAESDWQAANATIARLAPKAARWDAMANLWAHYSELHLTQDEDGRWSIRMIEAVESHRCETWTGDDPDAAIDTAMRDARGGA